jgi:hypothetical protein
MGRPAAIPGTRNGAMRFRSLDVLELAWTAPNVLFDPVSRRARARRFCRPGTAFPRI